MHKRKRTDERAWGGVRGYACSPFFKYGRFLPCPGLVGARAKHVIDYVPSCGWLLASYNEGESLVTKWLILQLVPLTAFLLTDWLADEWADSLTGCLITRLSGWPADGWVGEWTEVHGVRTEYRTFFFFLLVPFGEITSARAHKILTTNSNHNAYNIYILVCTYLWSSLSVCLSIYCIAYVVGVQIPFCFKHDFIRSTDTCV